MRSNKFIILSLLFAVTAVVSGCGQSGVVKQNGNQNQPVKNVNGNINQNMNANTNTNTNGEIDTSNWQIYRNEEYGFSVKYPEGWYVDRDEIIKRRRFVSFGTLDSYSGGGIFVIGFRGKPEDKEGAIKQSGSQFSDRQIKREEIIFSNNIIGELVTTKTGECCKNFDWISKTIFIEKNNILFTISDGADLIYADEFTAFYNSFKFTN